MKKIISLIFVLFLSFIFMEIKDIQAKAEGFILILEGNGSKEEKFIYDGTGKYDVENKNGINFDISSNTLNINNYSGSTIYIYDMDDINIIVEGNNIINATKRDHTETYNECMGYYNPAAYGFYIENTDATFTGNGKFSIDAEIGVYANNGKINFWGGEYSITSSSEQTTRIKGMHFFETTLEINGAKISIDSNNIAIDTDSLINVKGDSDISILSKQAGISSNGDLNISSGIVSVKTSIADAINCKNLLIKGGNLYAEAVGDMALAIKSDSFTIETGYATIKSKTGGIETNVFNLKAGEITIDSETVGAIFKEYDINDILIENSLYKVEKKRIYFGEVLSGEYYTFTENGIILNSFSLPDAREIIQVDFCYKTANVWQIIGIAFMILKILIPVLIIILGIIDISKVVVSADEKDIKDKTKSLAMRLAAGIIIFFIPTIVSFVFSLIANFAPRLEDYENCIKCITSPNKKCDTKYKDGIFPTE